MSSATRSQFSRLSSPGGRAIRGRLQPASSTPGVPYSKSSHSPHRSASPPTGTSSSPRRSETLSPPDRESSCSINTSSSRFPQPFRTDRSPQGDSWKSVLSADNRTDAFVKATDVSRPWYNQPSQTASLPARIPSIAMNSGRSLSQAVCKILHQRLSLLVIESSAAP
jgi:hypothetical protein